MNPPVIFPNDGTPVIQLNRDSVYGLEYLRCAHRPGWRNLPTRRRLPTTAGNGAQPSVRFRCRWLGGRIVGLYLTLNGGGYWMPDFTGGTFIPPALLLISYNIIITKVNGWSLTTRTAGA